MQAVKDDADWDLVWQGEVRRPFALARCGILSVHLHGSQQNLV